MHAAAGAMSKAYATSDMLAALILSTLAGLSTAVGGTAVLFVDAPSPTLVAAGLGMACFAMAVVSVMDLFVTAAEEVGTLTALTALALGMVTFYGLNAILSTWHSKPAGLGSFAEGTPTPGSAADKVRLWRVAVVSFVTLSLHNLPEGCAVAISSMNSGQMGMRMAVAIA